MPALPLLVSFFDLRYVWTMTSSHLSFRVCHGLEIEWAVVLE